MEHPNGVEVTCDLFGMKAPWPHCEAEIKVQWHREMEALFTSGGLVYLSTDWERNTVSVKRLATDIFLALEGSRTLSKRRNLDPRLTHRIVRADGYWGKGLLLSDAKAKYREVSGRKCPRECEVWAVTATTDIDAHGRFCVYGHGSTRAEPVNITLE
jgi:hypothetical protein